VQSFGQQGENILVSNSGDTAVIVPVQTVEINSKLEESRTSLKKYTDILQPNQNILVVDSSVRSAKSYLFEHKEKIYGHKDLSIRIIDDYKREWLGYEKESDNWQSTVSDRISNIDKSIFAVKVISSTWETTRQLAREENLPDEVLSRIADIVSISKSIDNSLKNKIDSLYVLQNSLTDYQISIDEVLDFLTQKREELMSDYFIRDSEPIWNAGDSTLQTRGIKSNIKNTANQNLRSIDLFLENNKNQAYKHLLIAILIILLLYYIGKNIKKNEVEESSVRYNEAQFFLKNYIASGLLLSFIFTAFIYANIPAAVLELVSVFLMIPALLLIRIFADRKLNIIFLSLVILFLIEEILIFLDPKTLLSRIILIIENLVTIWILFQAIRKKFFFQEKFKLKWAKFIVRFANIMVIVISMSFLCNLFGFVNLSVILSDTTITVILIGILLVLTVKAMSSVFIGLLNTKQLQVFFIVRNHRKYLIDTAYNILSYLAIFIWIRSFFVQFGLKDQMSNWLHGLMDLKWRLGSEDSDTFISFGGIIGSIIVVLITIYLTRIIKFLLEEELFQRIKFPRGVPGAISMLVRYVIVAFGIFIALSYAGIDLGKFGLIAGALGVGIGFGLQGVVYNFIAGLILAFERPIQKGDTIELGTLFGDVENIGVRSSTIKTYDGSEVIVPNGNLISNEVVNWTLSDRKRRREVKIGVAYGANPRDVLQLLLDVTSKHEEVLPNPKPWPLFEGFGESSLNFRILFWTHFDSGLTIQSEVAMMIYDALNDAGIHIPYPQRDLHVKSFDPTIQKTIFPFVSDKESLGKKRDQKDDKGDIK
jgi:small-conductance mechanosensitive channel